MITRFIFTLNAQFLLRKKRSVTELKRSFDSYTDYQKQAINNIAGSVLNIALGAGSAYGKRIIITNISTLIDTHR